MHTDHDWKLAGIADTDKDLKTQTNKKRKGLQVDEDALQICPTDIPQDCILYPVKVGADCNCLPYTGSIIAYGNEDRATEIRVKIIVKAVLRMDLYLSHEYLGRGIESTNKDLVKTCAFYSDENAADITLTKDQIAEIYKKEILKITQDKSYMGIWQIFALSSVLNRPIFSVYPNLGNPNVRKDLHRVIIPRQTRSPSMTYVNKNRHGNKSLDSKPFCCITSYRH